MKKTVTQMMTVSCLTLGLSIHSGVQADAFEDAPRFTGDKLVYPENYREWIYLSTGYEMTYGPAAQIEGRPHLFSNVFVHPDAYRAFKQSGVWPDSSAFILEVRGAVSESAENEQGKFQDQVIALEVLVKDEQRFKEGWGFFDFSHSRQAAEKISVSADCYSCHRENAAVEWTFVQFYPTLIDIAKDKGSFRETGFLQD